MSNRNEKMAFLSTPPSSAAPATAVISRKPSSPIQDLSFATGLAVVYFIAGKLGLTLASVHPSATAVWPPTGIALVAFLTLGYRVWPSIFVGALLTNLTTAGSPAVCLGIAAGNTCEGLLGCYLLNRFAGGREAFEHPKGIRRFALLAAMLSTTVSATFGVTSLSLGGFASWANYGVIWLTWWLGDAAGNLIVAPLLIYWGPLARLTLPRPKWNRERVLEGAALLLCLFLAGQIVFSGLYVPKSRHYPLEFLCLPAVMWAAFRFRPRGAALAVGLSSAIAIHGTLLGFGPFVRETQNESLLLLEAFTGGTAAIALILATVVEKHKQTENLALHLAVTDPMTGLANYRKLLEVLNAEIKRSDRTERPFALLLVDLDGLKKINDAHGHLVGSRALCRVAAVVRSHCRSTDTAARYGGDEFAVVLPEANAKAAEQVAQRICARVAMDPEAPRLSVSAGAAVFGSGGTTVEELLGAADHALYAMKGQHSKKSSQAGG
ncbi:MAG TPA: MASE1 domain-containing protein [Candidatus Saccharimonadales bacterium]|nr:MASE1 domain-containing protein [Candidatus Saccharimonadales bacterium]